MRHSGAAIRAGGAGCAGAGSTGGYDGRMELSGKTAVVTGAAVRLGRAVALHLAEHGCDVLVHYGSHAEEAASLVRDIRERAGRHAVAVRADLSAPVAATETIFAACEREFAFADILVNNAAIFEPCAFEAVDAAHWDRHHAINVKAPFFLAQRFAAQLADAPPAPFDGPHGSATATPRAGAIVNVLCRRATRPEAEDLPYTAAKAGLLALTKGLALKLAPSIRVNGVAPGAMLPPAGRDDDPGTWADRKAPEVPLRRVGGADPVARAVRYLCEADFVTGEVIHVAGGEQL